MSLAQYEAPVVEFHGSAVTEEIFWLGVLALACIAMIGTLAIICQLQRGNLSWGFNTFFGFPTSIWYQCNQR
jgi:hypothetical protein